MVSLAHKFAFECPHISAEAISAVVMPELARHYGVLGTPHMVLNGTHHLKGRAPEGRLLATIQALS
jgi:hypothetical protein